MNELQVKLPKQLQDQLRAAEAMRNAASSPEGGAAPQEGSPSDGSPLAGAPQSTTTENAPASPPAGEDDQSWEQKYNSLRGRLDQERKDKQTLIERMNDLETLIETMRAQGGSATSPTAAAPQYQKLLSEQEQEEYGEEMLAVVGKRAREELVPELDQVKAQLEQLKGRLDGVGNVMAKSEQQKVYEILNEGVPNWREVNVDLGFKDWLAQSDPYSGRSRQEMLGEAFSRHDGKRVLQFFKGYTEVTGTPPNTPSPGNAAPPLNNGSGQKPSLVDYAAPGRARSGQDTVSPDKPFYTPAQIARFYADRRVGKWKGREADADLIERDIFQAQHEGRILNS